MEKDAAYLLLLDEKGYSTVSTSTRVSLPGRGLWMGNDGTLGHTSGIISACALQWASTGDARFQKSGADRGELAAARPREKRICGRHPDEDSIFGRLARGEIKSSGFDLNGGWSPWYTVHKLMAGLVDAYLYCGNSQAPQIVSAMADWTENHLRSQRGPAPENAALRIRRHE